jgi:hypothetical protein
MKNRTDTAKYYLSDGDYLDYLDHDDMYVYGVPIAAFNNEEDAIKLSRLRITEWLEDDAHGEVTSNDLFSLWLGSGPKSFVFGGSGRRTKWLPAWPAFRECKRLCE